MLSGTAAADLFNACVYNIIFKYFSLVQNFGMKSTHFYLFFAPPLQPIFFISLFSQFMFGCVLYEMPINLVLCFSLGMNDNQRLSRNAFLSFEKNDYYDSFSVH